MMQQPVCLAQTIGYGLPDYLDVLFEDLLEETFEDLLFELLVELLVTLLVVLLVTFFVVSFDAFLDLKLLSLFFAISILPFH